MIHSFKGTIFSDFMFLFFFDSHANAQEIMEI